MKLIQILKDVVVVEHLLKPKSTTLHIPETADKHTTGLVEARVVYLGSKCSIKDEIKIGDTVLVPYHFGDRLVVDDKKLVVYNTEDVAAVITEEEFQGSHVPGLEDY